MLVRVLALAITLSAAQACTAAPVARPSGLAQSCETVGAETLRFSEVDASAARQSLEFAPGTQPDMLRVVGMQLVSGPCEDSLRAFVQENFYFSGGQVLARGPSGSGLVASSADALESSAILPNQPHPQTRNGQFIMAFRVGYRRNAAGLTTDYIGLWRKGGRSALRAFSELPDGRFTDTKAVLTSRLPVRSVTYFPSPDTASGRLGLIQEDPGGDTRLISLRWSHPTTFG